MFIQLIYHRALALVVCAYAVEAACIVTLIW